MTDEIWWQPASFVVDIFLASLLDDIMHHKLSSFTTSVLT